MTDDTTTEQTATPTTSPDATAAGTFAFGGDLPVARMGYGAMQLAGPGVFGPPKDRDEAIRVLRRAVELGVNHIDTSDFYGPYVVNELIREALHPYPDDLVLVTKVGARRTADASWIPALEPADLTRAVQENLDRLGIETIHGVNLRVGGLEGPTAGSIGPQFEALAGLQQAGLIRHLGVSNVSPGQLHEAQQIAPVATVQNLYNVAAHHDDALVDDCAAQGIAYVPFFPLGGFQPIALAALDAVAARHGVSDRQIALAWLLQRSPSILVIPGTSTVAHLADNVAAASIKLTADDLAELDQ